MSQNNIWGELLQSIAPNQNIRDYQHASRTFIDGLYRLSPKLNNLFHVFIDINPSLPYNDPLNPNHTIEERTQNWTAILKEFSTNSIDYTGLDNYRAIGWQRQLHLFEVPFYYIEYGIAQLGAIGMWMQFQQSPQKALENYMNALALGGTRTLPELYQTAGIEFNFTPEYVKKLMEFTNQQLEKLYH